MTGRERVKAVINHGKADRIPVWISNCHPEFPDKEPPVEADCGGKKRDKIIFEILLTNKKIHDIITEACE